MGLLLIFIYIPYPSIYLFICLLIHLFIWFRPVTSLKKKFWHRCFPENFPKFTEQNTSGGFF